LSHSKKKRWDTPPYHEVYERKKEHESKSRLGTSGHHHLKTLTTKTAQWVVLGVRARKDRQAIGTAYRKGKMSRALIEVQSRHGYSFEDLKVSTDELPSWCAVGACMRPTKKRVRGRDAGVNKKAGLQE